MLSLPYAGTRPCGPKVFLLLRALASPSTSAVVCACMEQGPWIVAQLPTASGNTVLQPSWRPSDGQQISWSWVPTCRATICTGAGSTHGGPPNVDFTLTLRLVHVWIRIRLSMMVIVFVFSVWIRRLRPIFPLFQVELCLAVRERWLTAANCDRRSHCSGTMPIFYFREARQLWTLYRHPMPCEFFRRDGNINKRTKLKSFLPLDRRSVSPHRPACVRALRGQWAIWLAPRLSLATESTGTVLIPSQMSEIAGHVRVRVCVSVCVCVCVCVCVLPRFSFQSIVDTRLTQYYLDH